MAYVSPVWTNTDRLPHHRLEQTTKDRDMRRGIVTGMLVLATFALLGGCAKKQQHAGYTTMDAVYIRYDADKNGVITKDEFLAQWKDKQKAESAWKKIDTKNNGFVTRTLDNDTPLSVWNDVESQNTPY